MRNRHPLSKVVLLLAAMLAAQPIVAADCARRIAAEGPDDRTVVLSGGEAWPLLRDYFAETKRRKLDVSPEDIQVVFQAKGKQETKKLPWAAMLTGASPERQWENKLKGHRAEPSPELLAQAASNNWDVMCVGKPQPPRPAPGSVTTAAGAANRQPVPPDPSFVQDGGALIFFKSGVQYASRREYTNALKEFKEVEKRDRRFPGLLMNIGVTYMQLKDYVRASDYLTRAVAQDPGDANTRLNMACLQARLEQYDDAIASLAAARANGMKMTPAIRKDPDLAALRGRSEFEALFATAEK